MKQLTAHQQEFLLENFFKNEHYHGWKNIATKLLTTGECIVALTENIWKGGVGNFITISDYPNSVGCSLYSFDLEIFLDSLYIKEARQEELSKLYNQINLLTEIYNDINILIQD